MAKTNTVYVVDTSVLIDYPDIVPNGTEVELEEATVDTSSAHIIIPTAVIRELSSFKKESSDRGFAARKILKRIREIAEKNHVPLNIKDSYEAKSPIILANGKAKLSILPLAKSFSSAEDFLFQPSDQDMNGQIILAALSTKKSLPDAQIILLTNDNGLAIRAFPRGIKTSRFGYRRPEPYTGRRDLAVPFNLYHRWASDRKLYLSLWEELMPNERPLVANEFIVMSPIDWEEQILGFSNIGRFDQAAGAIVPLKYLRKFPETAMNAGQAIYAETLQHPDIDVVIATGPAGCGKTYMATIYAINACKQDRYLGITVVPCHVEEDEIGFLPGDINEKLDPNVQPIKNAIRNHLLKQGLSEQDYDKNGKPKSKAKGSILKPIANEVNTLWANWFSVVPIAYARGLDFSYQIVIYDEFQDQSPRKADTLIKRQGENGKVIITGDIEQIHSAYLDQHNNGLIYASRQYMDHPRVAQVTLTADEVVRSQIVRDIAKRQEEDSDS